RAPWGWSGGPPPGRGGPGGGRGTGVFQPGTAGRASPGGVRTSPARDRRSCPKARPASTTRSALPASAGAERTSTARVADREATRTDDTTSSTVTRSTTEPFALVPPLAECIRLGAPARSWRTTPRSSQRVPECHRAEPTECSSRTHFRTHLPYEARAEYACRDIVVLFACPRHESNVRPPA